MVRTRQGLSILSIASITATSLLFASCKKNEAKPGDKPTAGGPAMPGVTPGAKAAPATPSAPAATGAAGEDLSYLPADSDVIAQIDIAGLRGSALFKTLVEPKLRDALKDAKMDEFKAKCGFDPVDSMATIALGVKSSSDDPTGVAVVHGFDKAKAIDCIDKMKEEMAKDGTTVTRDGDVFTISNKNSAAAVMTFVNGNTAVFEFGKGVGKDSLAAVTSGSKGVKSSQAFSDMYGKTKASTFRFFINGSMKQLQGPLAMGGLGKVSAVFGSIGVSDGLSVDTFMRMDTAAAATSAAATMQSQIGAIKGMVAKAEVTASDKDVRVDIGVTSQQLQSLLAMAGMGR